MNASRFLSIAAFLLPAIALISTAQADRPAAAAVKPLLDLSAPGAVENRLKPSWGAEGQMGVARSQDPAAPGVVVTIQPGGKSGYPGVDLKPEGAKSWDLSAFGHVEARVVNTGAKTLGIALRVDNEGDWHTAPWNTEQIYLEPGERGTVSVIFGHQYGHKPGYSLKPGAVVNIGMFAFKSDAVQSFRIESLAAGGPAGEKPPVDPAAIRIKPTRGILLGPGATIDADAQVDATGGAQASVATSAAGGQSVRIVIPEGWSQPSVALKPPKGRWDLCNATEVRVKVKNEGTAPLAAGVQVTSNGGPTDLVRTAAPLAVGAEQEIVVPFAPAATFKGGPVSKPGYYGAQKGTGTGFTSDAVTGVKITAKQGGPATLVVEAIVADAPAAAIPDWLGKRPPVPGDWVKTLDDDFDRPTVDPTKWNIYGPNYWDKRTHWSKDNLILGGGVAKFHFERKTGYHNDDPKEKQTEYACGFLETYGKWAQRYGYFEARVKLPTVPGLWPTFWLMPDRGPAAGPQWKRQDTGNGGMEFDIMEHLTRWGPHRYNIAWHWDGYGKQHTSLGSASNYVQADKDGFITPGLLWTPGLAVYYCNGKEIARWEDPRISNVQSSILIELTTGGWDNNAVDDAQLPADYLIDYVRVWQRRDLAAKAGE